MSAGKLVTEVARSATNCGAVVGVLHGRPGEIAGPSVVSSWHAGAATVVVAGDGQLTTQHQPAKCPAMSAKRTIVAMAG
jgi:hypothetical protein